MNMREKTILVVDDTTSNLDILSELLCNYDVLDATNGNDVLEIVQEEKIDLILLDIMMPQMDGFEVCQKLKEDLKTKDIPIIFITAMSDEDSIEKAYDIGGSDYVTKPFKPKELLARVKRELQLQDLQNELKLLASTDPLTKLYNRRYFMKTAKTILDLAQRNKTTTSVIILDIDKFKRVNDVYGHKVGDDVLVVLASSLLKNSRKSDITGRWGGEEFLLLLPGTDLNGAFIIAEKIRKKVEELVVSLENEQTLQFTVSLGVSEFNSKDDKNIGASINRADKALYRAKESGRNRVCQN